MAVHDLKNKINEMRYMSQQAMINFGWTPEQFDNVDHYRLTEIMSATKEAEIDPASLVGGRFSNHRKIGQK